jgi:3-methyladenine DNA glycosylase/8-oxoguanine DNA glycosylase
VPGPDLTTVFRPRRPLQLAATLRPVRRGPGDPAARLDGLSFWRATRTPAGPATQRLRQAADGEVLVEAWGPGAEWLVEHAPRLLGDLDDDSDFRPHHPLLRELQRRHLGLRICRTEAVYEAALGTIVEQKIPTVEAGMSWRLMLRALGEPAPGPLPGLMLPPAPELLARTPYHLFHPFRLERRRAETLRRAAAAAGRLQEAVGMPLSDARRRLCVLPGMGMWSAAEVSMVALGDADAVAVGDYHLPHMVSWALAGEPRGSDARMLELLEPYRGHRGRVIRLLVAAGIGAPRRGPRRPLRNWAVT